MVFQIFSRNIFCLAICKVRG